MNFFDLEANLDQFQEQQDILSKHVLEAVAPEGWTRFEDIARKLAAKEQIKADTTALEGVLPNILADATHAGLVEMNPAGDYSEWRLSDKGLRRLSKLQKQR